MGVLLKEKVFLCLIGASYFCLVESEAEYHGLLDEVETWRTMTKDK